MYDDPIITEKGFIDVMEAINKMKTQIVYGELNQNILLSLIFNIEKKLKDNVYMTKVNEDA